MKTPKIPVALEGYPFIVLAGFSTIICGLLEYDIAALIGILLTAFITYFFRDPARIVTHTATSMVAPADGKIIVIEKMFDDRFLNTEVHKISIFMNIFNVHVNRFPLAGLVKKIIFKPGSFYSADNNKAALHNEYCALMVKSSENLSYCVVQMAGLIARRIVCWAETGDEFRTGQRFGLIRFGSRVDLYLPLQITPTVTLGQKVVAGETVIGHTTGAYE